MNPLVISVLVMSACTAQQSTARLHEDLTLAAHLQLLP